MCIHQSYLGPAHSPANLRRQLDQDSATLSTPSCLFYHETPPAMYSLCTYECQANQGRPKDVLENELKQGGTQSPGLRSHINLGFFFVNLIIFHSTD